MVVRTRFRAILYPLVLYTVCGVASSYFVYTAVNGGRGLKIKADYKVQIAALRDSLDQLRSERAVWEHRIALMRSEAIDRDLLEEQTRQKLDFVDPRDVVVFFEAPRQILICVFFNPDLRPTLLCAAVRQFCL